MHISYSLRSWLYFFTLRSVIILISLDLVLVLVILHLLSLHLSSSLFWGLCCFLLLFISAIHYVLLFGFVSFPFFVCVISAQLVAQEEKLRLEEEAIVTAQREAARLAKERKIKEVRRFHWARPVLLLSSCHTPVLHPAADVFSTKNSTTSATWFSPSHFNICSFTLLISLFAIIFYILYNIN